MTTTEIGNSINSDSRTMGGEEKQICWVIKNDSINTSSIKAANQFLMDVKLIPRSEITIRKYRHILEKFLLDNPKNLQEIGPGEIHEWLIANYGSKKATTYNLSYRILSRFFDCCLQKEFISKSPIKRRWKRKLPYCLPKYLTEAEMARVKMAIDKMSLRDRALIYFFASSGCRRGEVARLTWGKIELDKRVATVIGKKQKVRVVDFDETSAFLLKQLKDTQLNNGEHVFLNKFGKPLSAHGISMIVEKVGVKAQLSQKLYCHRFRHTYATYQLAQGMELEEVRIKLGHVYLGTTCIYAGVMPEKLIFLYKKIME